MTQASPNYVNGGFRNPVPTYLSSRKEMLGAFRRGMGRKAAEKIPAIPVPVQQIPASLWSAPASQSWKVYWLGHSSLLLEMGGVRYLIDPVLSNRASLAQWVGPKRLHETPVNVADIPYVDAIVLTHDHYDHMDYLTLLALKDKAETFIVPLGVGSILQKWGFAKDKIIEADWWQEVQHKGNTLVPLPARHYSGRYPSARFSGKFPTLWCGWAFLHGSEQIFYSGDTGPMPYTEVTSRFNGFDLSIIPIGAYDVAWPQIHTTPEQAIAIHKEVNARLMLPVHWATFDLAMHSWSEPIERFIAEANQQHVLYLTPEPGAAMDKLQHTQPWWK